MKRFHEFRDPIHVFVRVDAEERRVVDSIAFQRLRFIHQLALTHLVYPGASHKRFEHSLGVMELASRIFDVVTRPEKLNSKIQELLPEASDPDKKVYWRRVLRLAALLHDVGHLPYSHAAERDLLPLGWDHERLGIDIIRCEAMAEVLSSIRPAVDLDDVIKLAVGPSKASDRHFSDWEVVLSEIITSDVFGADRMDYLLRDAYHAGVAYGRFDHHRLIDTLRILPPPAAPAGSADQLPLIPEAASEISLEPQLGVERGGLESAESLLLARYLMYSQVYLHPVRRIYDRHLVEFLQDWLPSGLYSTDAKEHLKTTDDEVSTAIRQAASTPGSPGNRPARQILEHKHDKLIYQASPRELMIRPDAPERVYEALEAAFEGTRFWLDTYVSKNDAPDFPVWNEILRQSESALSISHTLQRLPPVATNRIYVDRGRFAEVSSWLNHHLKTLFN